MQLVSGKFAKDDIAKYPFLKEASAYVQRLDLKIDDLADPALANILERAEERVEEAILFALTGIRNRNSEVEILSFPVALILVVATESSFIRKRYALAEAKQAFENMKLETKERIFAIGHNFKWNLASGDPTKISCEFLLSFVDYLKNTTHLKDGKWKLVNRIMSNGRIHLTQSEVVRLLSEEVRKYIEKRFEIRDMPILPPKITEIVEKIKKLSIEKIGKSEPEEFPKIIAQTSFPPCIDSLYQTFTSGRHLSHVGRFTLTSFLVNAGMSSEKVVELFRNVSDFNERMTRYQVEHIAGEKGSRVRYVPPKCDTLKTHGVCVNPDYLCQRISHPLAYYRKKLGMNPNHT